MSAETSRSFARLSSLCLLAALLAILPSRAIAGDPAELRTVLAVRPATIATALADMGHTVAAKPIGESVYAFEAEGGRFTVFLARCEAERCQMVQTRICMALPEASEARVARWNQTEMYLRASLQADGATCIDDTIYAPDRMITFAELRGQVEGVLGFSESAFARLMKD
jgi:hypothetical protein